MDNEKESYSSMLIIGVGNEFRSDDAAGLLIARRLDSRKERDWNIIEMSGEGGGLMNRWKNAGAVIIIDAVSSGANPGRIHRLDAIAEKIPANFFHYSTHAFGVAEAIELSRELGRLPAYMIIYGVEGRNFEHGLGLSPEVEIALPLVVERIVAEIESFVKSSE